LTTEIKSKMLASTMQFSNNGRNPRSHPAPTPTTHQQQQKRYTEDPDRNQSKKAHANSLRTQQCADDNPQNPPRHVPPHHPKAAGVLDTREDQKPPKSTIHP
jgi:hypothetical protein